MTETTSTRNQTSVPVSDLIATRWSPRGFDDSHTVNEEDLTALFEAARWGISGGNAQPWKFITAARGTAAYKAIDGAVASWNTSWAPRGSAYGVVLVNVAGEEGILPPADQRVRFYDVGMSVAQIALEAENRGLHIRQMAGADEAALRAAFGIGDEYAVVSTFAIGRVDDSEDLPEELRELDAQPRQRRPLEDVVAIHI